MEVFSLCTERKQSLEQWSPAQTTASGVLGIRSPQVRSTAKGKAKPNLPQKRVTQSHRPKRG